MGDIKIKGLNRDNAVLLLAATEELGMPRTVVRSQQNGFLVPEEVAKKAGLSEGDTTKTEAKTEAKESEPKKAPAKKTAAKRVAVKTPAKKAAAKKAAPAEANKE